ncbi:hypothetical protein predicted by Glimmer/Critica [Acetobacter ghanensis]|uniref:Uncharacterized protein n=1 Tax=Acetobacter ghanensis TaxID=431306 RepID=A0A0U5EZJ0_9PROT|nr:hypothetical protein predicted by Glimmer/Critica [Acetobacter ghanensis]
MCAQPEYVNTYIGIPAPEQQAAPSSGGFFYGLGAARCTNRILRFLENS